MRDYQRNTGNSICQTETETYKLDRYRRVNRNMTDWGNRKGEQKQNTTEQGTMVNLMKEKQDD